MFSAVWFVDYNNAKFIVLTRGVDNFPPVDTENPLFMSNLHILLLIICFFGDIHEDVAPWCAYCNKILLVFQFFLQFHFKMEKALIPPGQAPPATVKRPPPLMTGLGQHSDGMLPPPPGGIPGMPPPLPNTHGPGMPPNALLPPHLRPPMPSDVLWGTSPPQRKVGRLIMFSGCPVNCLYQVGSVYNFGSNKQ